MIGLLLSLLCVLVILKAHQISLRMDVREMNTKLFSLVFDH